MATHQSRRQIDEMIKALWSDGESAWGIARAINEAVPGANYGQNDVLIRRRALNLSKRGRAEVLARIREDDARLRTTARRLHDEDVPLHRIAKYVRKSIHKVQKWGL